jgi:hypothetical protein
MKDWVAWVGRFQTTFPPETSGLRKLCAFFDSKGIAEDFFRRIFVYESGSESVRLSVEEALVHPLFQDLQEAPEPARKRLPPLTRSISCPLKPK